MPDEVLICHNKELAAADRDLASYSSIVDSFKGGFRTHLQRTQTEWLKRRRACPHDVETGKIAPKSIAIECINLLMRTC
jgi:uncharacterized protein